MSSFTPRESRLDYLDLQGEAKDVFEFKIAASFTFEKLCGVGCSLPTITTTLLASSPIKEPELDGLLKIHEIFIGEVTPLIRQWWFSWDKVKLPREMMKRIAKFDMKRATRTVRSTPVLSNSLLFPNPLSTGYRLLDSQPRDTSEVSSFSQSHDSSEVSTFSLLSAPTLWSPSSGTLETNDLTFDDPNFMSTPISQQRNLRASSGNNISGGDILGSAVTARRLTLRIAEREGPDTCPSPSTSHITKVNRSLGISPPLPMAPPFILAADCHQQISTAPDPAVTNSKVTGRSNSRINHRRAANSVQMQTMLRSIQNGVSVMNHIYLMASDPPPGQHPDYHHISHEISTILSGIRFDHTALTEIWCCIYQLEGYGPQGWRAILAKEDIPEDWHDSLINVMTCAACQYFSSARVL